MATLTLDLIRKKAEHHSDSLSTLQELSLHQLNLANLTPILSQACPQLRILYLHNNLLPSLPTFRQLHRLKSLTYLNLTLNNITHLPQPHLAALEKLCKLDLTLNHIPLSRLDESMAALAECVHLSELFLTGNPCMVWSGCRLWVVGRLTRLQRLDGRDVTRSERLEAKREWPRLAIELQLEVDRETQQEEERQQHHTHDEKAEGAADSSERDTRFTPALRLRMYEEQQAAEAKQQADAAASSSKFATPTDLYSAAKQRLNTFLDPAEYSAASLPSQRNVGRYAFTLTASSAAMRCVVLRVELPRHMDTSSIRVDVQPWWLQVDVRGSLLVLHTGEEVEAGRATVKRVTSDGTLVINMPVVWKEEVAGREEKEGQLEVDEEVAALPKEKEQVVVVRGKPNNSRQTDGWERKTAHSEQKHTEDSTAAASGTMSSSTASMTEVRVKRSVTLEAKRQQKQEADKQRQLQSEQRVYVDDDDDVPPLI